MASVAFLAVSISKFKPSIILDKNLLTSAESSTIRTFFFKMLILILILNNLYFIRQNLLSFKFDFGLL